MTPSYGTTITVCNEQAYGDFLLVNIFSFVQTAVGISFVSDAAKRSGLIFYFAVLFFMHNVGKMLKVLY